MESLKYYLKDNDIGLASNEIHLYKLQETIVSQTKEGSFQIPWFMLKWQLELLLDGQICWRLRGISHR